MIYFVKYLESRYSDLDHVTHPSSRQGKLSQRDETYNQSDSYAATRVVRYASALWAIDMRLSWLYDLTSAREVAGPRPPVP